MRGVPKFVWGFHTRIMPRSRGVTPTERARLMHTGSSFDEASASSSRPLSPGRRGNRDVNPTADDNAALGREERSEALLRQLLSDVQELKADRNGRRNSGDTQSDRGGSTTRPKPQRPSQDASTGDSKKPWVRLHSPLQARYFYLNMNTGEVIWEATECSGGWECFALPNQAQKVRPKSNLKLQHAPSESYVAGSPTELKTRGNLPCRN